MKRIGWLSLSITATLLLTLAFSAAAANPKAPAATAAVAPASPTVVAPVPPPPHPNVHAALEAMRNARGRMQAAEGEFHGHRDKAIEHLDQAIHEAEICEREP
jgi:phosphate-selective porin